MLTLQKLMDMAPGIFAQGQTLIEHPWFNDAHILYNDKGEPWLDEVKYGEAAKAGYRYVFVNWVATRGNGYHDWTIYHSLDGNLTSKDFLDGREHLEASPEKIARLGAKMYSKIKIRELVECDDESFGLYRF